MRLKCSSSSVILEKEVQQLRDLILQLRAYNEQLLQEMAVSQACPSIAINALSVGASATVAEQLVVVTRDQMCLIFNGKTGIGLREWTDEIQACMWACHLSAADQAFFIFLSFKGRGKG